jgi:hypothetical protein
MLGHVVSSSLRLRALVVVAAIVMAVGVVSLRRMPVNVYPEILPVTVRVQTETLGLSAEEVEQLITVPIEADLLTGAPWMDVMRSESVPGLSSVELQFKDGTDPMHARQVVQERLTQAHALPNVSKPPDAAAALIHESRDADLAHIRQAVADRDVGARALHHPPAPPRRPGRGERGRVGPACIGYDVTAHIAQLRSAGLPTATTEKLCAFFAAA